MTAGPAGGSPGSLEGEAAAAVGLTPEPPARQPISPAELDPLKALYRAARRSVWARLIAQYSTSEWTEIGLGGATGGPRPPTLERADPLLARWMEIRGSSWYWPLTQTIKSVLPYVGGEWSEAGLGGGESPGGAEGSSATGHQVATDWGTGEASAGSAGPAPERLGEDEGWAE